MIRDPPFCGILNILSIIVIILAGKIEGYKLYSLL